MARTKTVLFAITIDTEVDKSPTWEVSPERSFRSVTEGIPHLLSPLLDEHEAKPTYLLSSEVMMDDNALETLRSLGSCELGTHLHGEMVGDPSSVLEMANVRTAEMQCSYPREIELEKMRVLTNLFTSRFGRRPLSFRAGRFGAGGNTVSCLEELGYLVDTSVTPSVLWDYPEGRSDFTRAGDQPYIPSRENISIPGSSRLLEVPISITCSMVGRVFNKIGAVRNSGLLRGVVNRASPAIWVRPSHTSASRMIRAIETLLRRNAEREVVVLNMMLHSMEVIPNASPVTRSEREVGRLLGRMADVLRYGRQKGFEFATLSEIVPFFQPMDGSPLKRADIPLPLRHRTPSNNLGRRVGAPDGNRDDTTHLAR